MKWIGDKWEAAQAAFKGAFSKWQPAKNELSSLAKWTGRDGNLLPERKALHDRIIDGIFKDAKPQENPVFTIMGGGSASGKSTMIDKGFVKLPKGSVTVDSDAIKAMLPEYQKMIAAGDKRAAPYVHKESSEVAGKALAIGNKKGYNVVLDGTGDGSVESLTKKIMDAKSAGMRVEGVYATVPTQMAVDRSLARAAKTGRDVPIDKIIEKHRAVSDVLPKCAHLMDKVELYDTSGDVPVLIATGGNGKGLKPVKGREWIFEGFLNKVKE